MCPCASIRAVPTISSKNSSNLNFCLKLPKLWITSWSFKPAKVTTTAISLSPALSANTWPGTQTTSRVSLRTINPVWINPISVGESLRGNFRRAPIGAKPRSVVRPLLRHSEIERCHRWQLGKSLQRSVRAVNIDCGDLHQG